MGCTLPQDTIKAEMWHQKAKNSKKDEEITSDLSAEEYLEMGRKANKVNDYGEAFKNFQKAADMGNALGITNLGAMYRDGNGVDQNFTKAIESFRQAADKGEPTAMVFLGEMYNEGKGVKKNTEKALEWIIKGSKLHEDAKCRAAAMMMAGSIYILGEGIKQQPQKGIEWLNRAADLGNKEAMFLLGQVYLEGFGINRNLDAAFDWFSRANKSGHSQAKEKMDYIVKEKNNPKGDMSRLNDSQKDVIQFLKQEGYNDTSLAEIVTKYEQNDRLVMIKAMYWGDKYRYYLPIGGSKRDNADSVIYYIGKYLGKW